MRRTCRDGSGTVHWSIPEVELLKLQKSGQFANETVRIKGTQISLCNLPDVLATVDTKEDSVRGIVIIVSSIFSNFLRDSLIK